MSEQEIKSEITKKLNQGYSKTFLYNYFKDKIKDESLRKILASRPSYELKLKFKKMHLGSGVSIKFRAFLTLTRGYALTRLAPR